MFNVKYEDLLTQLKDIHDNDQKTITKLQKKLDEYKINHEADKAIMDDVEKMVNKNMSLDVLISNEVNRVMEQNNRNMKDFVEGEFTKIAARSIKSRKKIDTMFVVLLTSNIITILGLIALYLFK